MKLAHVTMLRGGEPYCRVAGVVFMNGPEEPLSAGDAF